MNINLKHIRYIGICSKSISNINIEISHDRHGTFKGLSTYTSIAGTPLHLLAILRLRSYGTRRGFITILFQPTSR